MRTAICYNILAVIKGGKEYGNERYYSGDRCFGVVANMDFILICTYEANGENPELIIYKKR